MPNSIQYWIRYAHTLRHLRPIQVTGRVRAALKQRFGKTPLPDVPASLETILPDKNPKQGHDPWNTPSNILTGVFTFLNQSHDLGTPVNWKAEDLPLLWQFNLHYFHYLHLLRLEDQIRLCQSWIRAHPPGAPVAWHAYPTSLRLVNWCKTGMRTREVLESMYLQAAHLFRNIEYHVTGNHVIENARALVVAGHFFNQKGEARDWFDKGLALILREIDEQVLPDGGHYERSPMYQALMLDAFLDVLEALPEHHPVRPVLKRSITAMVDFLVSMTHPDGHLVLFNDATQEIAPPIATLLDEVKGKTGHTARKKAVFSETGYYLHQGKDVFLAIDAGAAGPRHLMAHAHADIFSYELSLSGEQFIVDSGVYEYQRGPMRDYVRSTRAHNTVCIDDKNQVECWDAFRVGRRWQPDDVVFASDGGQTRFDGIYGGYAHLIGDKIVHQRKILVNEKEQWIRFKDRVEGEGTHKVESLIHLHPDVTIVEKENGFELNKKGTTCHLNTESAQLNVTSGWYCPEFGMRLSNTTLVLGGTATLPVNISYTISY